MLHLYNPTFRTQSNPAQCDHKNCIISYSIACYCIVGFGARAVSRKTPIYFTIVIIRLERPYPEINECPSQPFGHLYWSLNHQDTAECWSIGPRMCDGVWFFYAGLQRRSKDESEYQIQGLILCVLVCTIVGKQTRRTSSELRDAIISSWIEFREAKPFQNTNSARSTSKICWD